MFMTRSSSVAFLSSNSGCIRSHRAFTLVEVVIAIGIFSFGVVVLFTLLPAGINSVKEGKLQEVATDVLTAVAADMRNTGRSSGLQESPIYGLQPYAASPQVALIDLDAFGAPADPLAENVSEAATLRLRATPRSSENPELVIWHLAIEPVPQSAIPRNLAETVLILGR